MKSHVRAPQLILDSKGDTFRFKKQLRGFTTAKYQYGIEKFDMKFGVILSPRQIERNFSKDNRVTAKAPIVQQGRNECAIAAMAMFLERPLAEVKESFLKFGWDSEKGASLWQQKKVVRDFGYISLIHDELPNDKCIFTLDSLNIPGKLHALYWNEEEVLDPQTNNSNVFWYGPEWGPEELGGFQYITKTKIKA